VPFTSNSLKSTFVSDFLALTPSEATMLRNSDIEMCPSPFVSQYMNCARRSIGCRWPKVAASRSRREACFLSERRSSLLPTSSSEPRRAWWSSAAWCLPWWPLARSVTVSASLDASTLCLLCLPCCAAVAADSCRSASTRASSVAAALSVAASAAAARIEAMASESATVVPEQRRP
jgi:hypothetical protein